VLSVGGLKSLIYRETISHRNGAKRWKRSINGGALPDLRKIWLHRVNLRAFAETTHYGRYWHYIVDRLETEASLKIAIRGAADAPPDKNRQKCT
jgi:hypothetical protein